MYLNGIVTIRPRAKFIISVEDTSQFFSGNDIHELINNCNAAVKTLDKWSASNCMKVNEAKPKGVISRSKNKPIPTHRDIILHSGRIEEVSHFKCLGNVCSSDMFWENHVNDLLTKNSSNYWRSWSYHTPSIQTNYVFFL